MSLQFAEVRFPDRIARGARAVIRSSTKVVTTGGGAERRTKRWKKGPLRTWDATRGIRSTSDLEDVRAWRIVMDGRFLGFRFKDFSDFTASDQTIDTSAGGSAFQLRKGYPAANLVRWREIKKPVKGTTRLTLNGQPCVVLEDGQTIEEYLPLYGELLFGEDPSSLPRFTLDTTTGVLSVVQPAGLTADDVLQASFEFDCPARFGSDEFAVRANSRGRNWEYEQILIEELRDG